MTQAEYDAQRAQMAKAGIKMPANPPGLMEMPIAPDYNAAYDANTQSLRPGVDTDLAGIQDNRGALQQFNREATRTGPSSWANLSRQQQASMGQDARSGAQRDIAGQQAQMRHTLAAHGGLDGGQRERMARQGQKDVLNMGQDIRKQGMQNDMQIGINDEQNRVSQLGQAVGMNNQAVATDMEKAKMRGLASQFDITNAVKETQAKNQFAMDKYNTGMTTFAAGRQADATEKAGK